MEGGLIYAFFVTKNAISRIDKYIFIFVAKQNETTRKNIDIAIHYHSKKIFRKYHIISQDFLETFRYKVYVISISLLRIGIYCNTKERVKK